jgi:hypothetical protein
MAVTQSAGQGRAGQVQEAAVERATMDRIQQQIDEETAGRFPADAAPHLILLRHGDHPVVEPGELWLRVVLDPAVYDTWMEEHGDRLCDFRQQRLPEVKGFVLTTDVPDSAGHRPNQFLMPDDISLLDPEKDEIARGLTPVMFLLGSEDRQTLDALITAGITASRTEAIHWALTLLREQPAYQDLSQQPHEPGGRLDPAAQNRLQGKLNTQVKDLFPEGEVQQVTLLQYGDDPWIEPGDLVLRIAIAVEEGADPPLPAWDRDHEAVIHELHVRLADDLPAARFLEFYFGDAGRHGKRRMRLGKLDQNGKLVGCKSARDPVGAALSPADLQLLDALIAAGQAASRTEAVSWVLARIRERPAYARLNERARELAELRDRF